MRGSWMMVSFSSNIRSSLFSAYFYADAYLVWRICRISVARLFGSPGQVIHQSF
jgi:hypothetical protein